MSSIPMPWHQLQALARPQSFHAVGWGSLGVARWPSDPVGVFNLTLLNAVAGSAVRIEVLSTGAEVYSATAPGGDMAIPLQAYASGSPLNSLRIKVRKGTGSPTYIPFETQTTAVIGSKDVFVSQTPDE